MTIGRIALAAAAATLWAGSASADCAFENDQQLSILSAGFEAWKAVTDAMAECGNVEAELDQEFRTKQPEALAADPALYDMGGVANSTIVPLLNQDLIRPLNAYVEKYGEDLRPNQLIRQDGDVVAIAMMVNTQHLMYREDILEELDIEVPTTWEEVLDAAAKIREAGLAEYPLGATMASGWNLAQDFVNMHLGHGGEFLDEANQPLVNSPEGIAALETMKRITEYTDPEFLVSDSTYVQQQFQQGKIAMANLWSSRAGAMDDPDESEVVGLVEMAAAPAGPVRTASTIWWDGVVIARNISEEEADAAFRVMLEGMDAEMVQEHNDVAVWLIDGYEPGRLALGAIATAQAGALPYPASTAMGMMHTALGNELPAYFTGEATAEEALAAVEEAYLTAAEEAGVID
jgi:ABC-type glycerol-3-phosphate transport system substrate-binding protein